jgi:hypothetical protein
MPSASNNQRALMQKWFGNEIDDGNPMRFLQSHGWTEKSGMLIKPTPSHTVSAYELECCLFLRDEWDYGFMDGESFFYTDVYKDASIPSPYK